MIRGTITGVEQTIQNLTVTIPAEIGAQLDRNMLRAVIRLQSYVVKNKLQGQVLNHRTGHLSRSINYDVARSGAMVTGTVGVGKEAPYGKTHELGGTVSIPESLRRSKLGKKFPVRAYQATYPKRAFLLPSLEENADQIVSDLQGDLTK